MVPCIAPGYKLRAAIMAARHHVRRTKRKSAPVPPIQKIKISQARQRCLAYLRRSRVLDCFHRVGRFERLIASLAAGLLFVAGDGIHNTRADALDDAIAQLGGGRLGRLHDAPPGSGGSLRP